MSKGPLILLAALVLVAGAFSCSQAVAQRIPTEPASYRPDEVKIGLERTVCFGSCPVYTITIRGDGTVEYVGARYVGVEGSRQGKVSPEQVATLINAFLKARIFDGADVYDGREMVEFRDGQFVRTSSAITDVPSQILSIELGNRKKQVQLRYNVPAELGRLPDLVDEVAQSKQWTAIKQ